MALKGTSYEGGTAGSALSTSNPGTSGADSAFNTVTTTGTATATVSNADAVHGTQCQECVQTSSTSSTAVGIYSGYTATSAACRFYFKFTTLPSGSNVIIMRSFNNSAARWLSVSALSTGFLRLQLTSSDTTAYTSTASMVANTWYRVEWSVTMGNSNNATVNFQWYQGDSSSAMDAGYASTTQNTGTGTQIADFRYGIVTSTQAITLRIDDPAQNDGTTTFLGASGATKTLTDTGSGADVATVAATVPLADTGTVADTASISADVPMADTGASSDLIAAPSATVPLPDVAAGADDLGISATLTLPEDPGAADDALTIEALVALLDVGAVADNDSTVLLTTAVTPRSRTYFVPGSAASLPSLLAPTVPGPGLYPSTGQYPGSAIGTSSTPPDRTVTVDGESRVVQVPAESRTVTA